MWEVEIHKICDLLEIHDACDLCNESTRNTWKCDLCKLSTGDIYDNCHVSSWNTNFNLSSRIGPKKVWFMQWYDSEYCKYEYDLVLEIQIDLCMKNVICVMWVVEIHGKCNFCNKK